MNASALTYLARLKPDSPEFLKIRNLCYRSLYEKIAQGKISPEVAQLIADSHVYDSPNSLAILLLLGKD
jgi:hypothetical protein